MIPKTVPSIAYLGDGNQHIHLWNPTQDGRWHVDAVPYAGGMLELAAVSDM